MIFKFNGIQKFLDSNAWIEMRLNKVDVKFHGFLYCYRDFSTVSNEDFISASRLIRRFVFNIT